MSSEDMRARVQQLRDAELKLDDGLAAAKIELVAARAREAGSVLAAALDGVNTRKTGEGAAAIAERIAALTAGVAQARDQRVDAITAVWAAEAAEARHQAAAKHAEADAHAAKTAELLAPLQAHEGCDYAAVSVSRGRLLHVEAQQLDERADRLLTRKVVQGGGITATTRDDLVTALAAWDVMKVAPVLSEALAWYDRCAGSDVPPGTTVRLVWRDGAIDAAGSTVTRPPTGPDRLPARGVVISDGPIPAPRVETFVIGRSSAPPIPAPGIRVSR